MGQNELVIYRRPEPEPQARTPKLKTLEDKLARQTRKLVELGFAKEAKMTEERFQAACMETLWGGTRELGRQKTPDDHFTLVVPSRMVPLKAQLAKVHLNGKLGATSLQIESVLNTPWIKAPQEPYVIWGADLGKQFGGTSPEKAWETMKNKNGSRPLKAQELIAFFIQHPEVSATAIRGNEIVTAGSMFKGPDSFICFWDDDKNEVVRMGQHWAHHAVENRWTAFCEATTN